MDLTKQQQIKKDAKKTMKEEIIKKEIEELKQELEEVNKNLEKLARREIWTKGKDYWDREKKFKYGVKKERLHNAIDYRKDLITKIKKEQKRP